MVLIPPRPNFKSALLQKEEEWLEMFQLTFTGPLEALKCAIPYLSKGGKIVFIAGTTSVQLLPDYGPVCIIRRMWTSYAKALSHQLGRQGISVNTLSPGVVLTDFHRARIGKQAEENALTFDAQLAKDTALIPLQRHANPQEASSAIHFLLSPDSDFINGVNLLLDGGLTLTY